MTILCIHCQIRIVQVNFALGQSWMHQPEGASGQDGQYRFCKLSEAEPSSQQQMRYVIHPGWVKSQSDGDTHFIGFGQLCRLYHVDYRTCIDASNEQSWVGRDPQTLEHLYPRSDGKYP